MARLGSLSLTGPRPNGGARPRGRPFKKGGDPRQDSFKKGDDPRRGNLDGHRIGSTTQSFRDRMKSAGRDHAAKWIEDIVKEGPTNKDFKWACELTLVYAESKAPTLSKEEVTVTELIVSYEDAEDAA